MSTHLKIVDVDTRLGAVRREVHWTLVTAATAGGLTYTWIGHALDWSPGGFLVHGLGGIIGGYLVGTGVARAVTGMRVRPIAGRYTMVPIVPRAVTAWIRFTLGAVFLTLSYLLALL